MKDLFHRYERWDQRWGPHMRTLWLFIITVIVLISLNSQSETVDDVEALAKQNQTTANRADNTATELALLRRESVPVANRRNAALCNIARVFINERREEQRQADRQELDTFLEPLRQQDPEAFDRLIARQRAREQRRTERLERNRQNLDCAPIPQGP